MEAIKRPTSRGRNLPAQEFNGKVYHLYPGERYYSRGTKRLHRVVWEYYNGAIPPDCEIHHKDGNPHNNDISNLACIPHGQHKAEHREESIARGKSEKGLANIHAAMEAAKEWHGSDAGHDWHSNHAREQWEGKEEREAVCECCGKVFRYRAIQTPRFCTNACKSKWRREAGLDNETRTCVICGKEFRANHYSDTCTCSRSCGAKYRWKVRREKAAGL
jgi:hypothetical protein